VKEDPKDASPEEPKSALREAIASSTEPTPLDLISLDQPGYEVWASRRTTEVSGHQLPKLLLVTCEYEEELILTIIDPQTTEELFSTDDYLEIVDYLLEEGYVPVEGQVLASDADGDEPNGP
jgi:hypothetical protein